jgi:hypothetical protein
MKGVRSGLRLLVPIALAASLYPVPCSTQTFVQLTDLGSGIGARLTRTVADSALDRYLFGAIGTKVSYINYGAVFQFASDPAWGRVLSGKMGEWIHEFTGLGFGGADLRTPMGIDITFLKRLYIADPLNGWVVFADFSESSQNLINPTVWAHPDFPRPVDVAWDGQTNPLVVQYMYVVDDSVSRISYWNRSPGGTQSWSYGSPGSGQGQFWRPSGVCVGKTAGPNGGTVFTTDFYVVDRGNHRVVWLRRGAGTPTWQGTYSMPAWDPADCAVDHFGNLYVVDEAGHRIHKFTSALYLLSSYGTYGKGRSNLNTLAFPHAISVPCGRKYVNSVTVWYCEGRVITAEAWSNTTGAVEHFLGTDAIILAQPQTVPGVMEAWFGYKVTDHATHTVEAVDWNGFHVRTLSPAGLAPSGTHYPYWDGLDDYGVQVPEGYYRFRFRVVSAYGCAGQSWCDKTLTTDGFLLTCGPAGCYQLRMDSVAVGTNPAPDTVFLRQRVLVSPAPLARIDGAAANAPAEPTAPTPGTLSNFARQFGVRGLRFALTRDASTHPVSIRVFSLSGRLVRTLVNDRLEPGIYEIGWDGLDDRGSRVAPGVYMAIMIAGSSRLMQRLILR